jgi:hypothetical protein
MPVPKRHDQAMAEAEIPNASRRAPSELYGDDLYTWAIEQAAALRAGDLESLDLANLAEEIEDLGSEQLHKLTSAYRIILAHMLKWDYQPERRSRSWATSINSQRVAASDVLEDSPGLETRRNIALARAYRRARIEAGGQTGLGEAAFPAECPYSLDEVMTREFPWPLQG